MDATSARLVDFAMAADFVKLPRETVHECKRRIVDSVACALGAYDEPLSQSARALAARYPGAPAATLWGTRDRASVEAAAFANGVMLRYLDYSDAYPVKSRGHPSDVIAAVLAVAEAQHASGAAAIAAVTLAYDVFCTFCETVDINTQGWDQPVYAGMATALAAARLVELPRDAMAHALALTVAPNMALYQTRRGAELSSWKGCAAANACRNAIFAVLLARDGFTGPSAVFEGRSGLWDIVGATDWRIRVDERTPHRVALTHMKSYPACYHGLSAISAALEIRGSVAPQDVEAVRIDTYRQAIRIMADDPTRWNPQTRETADHSLPYVYARALLDGEITSASFSDEKIADPAVRSLMQSIRVEEDPALNARHPEAAPCRVHVTTRSGGSYVSEIDHPRGHAKNPMTDGELDAKFADMFSHYGGPAQCERVLRALRALDEMPDVAELPRLLAEARRAH